MNFTRFLLILLSLFLISNVYAKTVIFSTDFDRCDDWTIVQTSSNKSNIPNTWTYGQTDFPCGVNASTGTGARWVGWYDSKTYMVNNLHNTVTLGSSNARSGKAITHYQEVPATSSKGEASSGSLYLSLTTAIGDPSQGYDDIWVTVWRKFDAVTPYYTNGGMQKFLHISSYNAAEGSITGWFGNEHLPSITQGTLGYDLDSFGYKLRWFYSGINLYPIANRNDYTWVSGDLNQGIYKDGAGTKIIYVYAKLQSGTQHGGWQRPGNYGDGNYYLHEYHVKMNSAPGVADGVYEYFINGICQWSISNIPFVKSGSTMVKWNTVVFGSNNDYSNPGGEYETFYAFDDIVISDYRVGKDYVINDYRTTGGAAVIGGRIK